MPAITFARAGSRMLSGIVLIFRSICGIQSRVVRRFIHASIAGKARALTSAAIMIASYARAATSFPPDVACAGAKPASSAACAASLKTIMKLAAK